MALGVRDCGRLTVKLPSHGGLSVPSAQRAELTGRQGKERAVRGVTGSSLGPSRLLEKTHLARQPGASPVPSLGCVATSLSL